MTNIKTLTNNDINDESINSVENFDNPMMDDYAAHQDEAGKIFYTLKDDTESTNTKIDSVLNKMSNIELKELVKRFAFKYDKDASKQAYSELYDNLSTIVRRLDVSDLESIKAQISLFEEEIHEYRLSKDDFIQNKLKHGVSYDELKSSTNRLIGLLGKLNPVLNQLMEVLYSIEMESIIDKIDNGELYNEDSLYMRLISK